MNFKEKLHSYGLSIILSGQPIVWIIRDLAGAGESQAFSIVYMLTGIYFLIYRPNLGNCLAELFFPVISNCPFRLIPLIFTVPAFIASLLNSPPDIPGSGYILFTILFLVALNTVPYEKLKYLPYTLLTISGSGCIFVLLYAVANGIQLDGQRLIAASTNSPGIVSTMGADAVFAGLFMIKHYSKIISPLRKYFAYISIFAGTAVVILSVVRSTFVSLILCFFIMFSNNFLSLFTNSNSSSNKIINFIFKPSPHRKNFFLYSLEFKCFIIAILCLVIGLNWDIIMDNLSPITDTFSTYQEQLTNYFQNGVETFTEGGSKEASAAHRRDALKYALENFKTWGHGYKALWLDIPIVQAFYDMGVIVGIIFLTITLIIPIFKIVRLKYLSNQLDPIINICIYQYLLMAPMLISHGQPYDFYKWLRIILLFSVISKLNNFIKQYKYKSYSVNATE